MFDPSESILNYVRLSHETNRVVSHNLGINKSLIIPYQCESSLECFPITVALQPGKFHIELWGAQGGDNNNTSVGGSGGYTEAVMNIYSYTTLFLYIGGQGESGVSGRDACGGYNGGGNGSLITDSLTHGGGGGSTDLRLNESEYSRILVAGAGGGAGYRKYTRTYSGGAGGGESGIEGEGEEDAKGGTPGNQNEFGKACNAVANGYFFRGGNAIHGDFSSGGGGGSGYWGGAGGCSAGGGGGSGYVAPYLEGNTIDGTQHFSDGYEGTEQGHKGNGMAKITLIVPKYRQKCSNRCLIHNQIKTMIFISIFYLSILK